jgi:cell division protein FtsW
MEATRLGSSAAAPAAAEVVWVKRGPIDTPLLVVVLALTGLGVVMVYSASSVVAEFKYEDATYFLTRQLWGVGAGLLALVVGLRLDYRWYQRLTYPLLAVAFALLALVFVPGLGETGGGARRWLVVGGVRLQPAEVVKVIALFYLAYSITKKQERMRSFTLAFIPHTLVIGGMVVLLMPQPDFGTSAMLMVMMGLMLFLGGARVSYLLAMVIGAGFLAYDAIVTSDYRLERLEVFLNPESHRQGEGWQISESLLALGSGGVTGLGLGQGHLKLGWVPELWNDFIATIIGHELGLLGLGIVVSLYLVLLWRGVRIAQRALDPYGALLALGITALLILQAATNLGVVMGLLPTKGLTLPFVSYGRTSVVVCLFCVGVLLNISQRNPDLWQEACERREQERQERELARKKERLLANRRQAFGRSEG